METKTYALFQGRHELPQHEGALYSPETTGPFGLVEAPARAEALAHFAQGGTVEVLVTGLTAALLDFVAACHKVSHPSISCKGSYMDDDGVETIIEAVITANTGQLVALHHDRESGRYLPQQVI